MLFRHAVLFDRPPNDVQHLVRACGDRQVGEAPLNLRPLVAHLAREPECVLLEQLVQDADHDEPPVAARGQLRELLKDIDVGPVVGGGLEELPHLVDEHDQASAFTRGAPRDAGDVIEYGVIAPAAVRRHPC